MRPPEINERAQREAKWLVQLAIEAVTVTGDAAAVTGTVARVFRGERALLDTKLTLSVPILRNDAVDRGTPGDLGRTPLEQLRPGRVLEAYLDDTEQGPRIALDLSMVLDAATEQAQLPAHLAPKPVAGERRIWPIVVLIVAVLLCVLAALVLR